MQKNKTKLQAGRTTSGYGCSYCYWLMRTPQGIADLITAHGQHASLSFLNRALEVCVANGGFRVVQHL